MESSDCGCCPFAKICSDRFIEDSIEFEIVEVDPEETDELDLEEITFEWRE